MTPFHLFIFTKGNHKNSNNNTCVDLSEMNQGKYTHYLSQYDQSTQRTNSGDSLNSDLVVR